MRTVRLARLDEVERIVAIDDAASTLYQEAGLDLQLPSEHPFVLDEVARWRSAIEAGSAWVSVDASDAPAGFVILGEKDGWPYLDQVSVHPDYGRQGRGRALIAKAIDVTDARPLWLTTYAHIDFNRPLYERLGFRRAPAPGPELRKVLAEQRRYLPDPDQRIAMVRDGQ